MNNFFNGIKSTLGSIFNPTAGLDTSKTQAPFHSAPQQTNSAPAIQPFTPKVASTTVVTPTIPKINIASTDPTPNLLPIKQPNFSIDTSNITSDHLATDNTPSSVLAYRNKLQNDYQAFLDQQKPLQTALVSQTQYSPDYMSALNQNLDTNQGYRAGINNIRGQAIPLEFQQGQEAALTRDTALTKEANAENLALQEAIRTNNISALNTGIQNNQTNYQNQFAATQAGQNFGIQQGQLDISQQGANQSRYEYQQITNPNTGFPTIQIIDRQTGLPSGNIDPSSAQGQALIKNGAVGGVQQGNGVVGGYDITSYATDPNHEKSVNNIFSAINQAVGGQITDAGTAQAVINQLSPKSPITGQMVIDAATKYGVDPSVMISIMQQDSILGTAGKATRTFNPGNVGNDDSGKMNDLGSWSNGVDAVAKWLSGHKAQSQQQNSGTELPTLLQQYLTPEGVQGISNTQYINEDKVAPNQIIAVKNLAARSGVPVLNGDEVSKIRSIDVTKQNLVDMQSTISTILGSGVAGRIGSSIKNILGAASQSDPKVASFNNYRTTAINTLQGLGAGSGGSRITVGEIQAATDNLPLITDNIETANAKLAIVNGFLDKWVKQILPNSGTTTSTQESNNNDPLGLGI